jgi:hypothetical protein
VLIGVVVAILVGIGVAGFFALRDDGTSTAPDDSIVSEAPDDTEPDVLAPTVPDDQDVTIPDVTIPDLSIPDLSIPDLSIPDFSIPDLSIPDVPPTRAPPGSIPEATESPDGLGDDASLDALARECFDGSMDACDDLFDQSDDGTDYQRYGDTCAGRQPENTQVYCATSFPS